MILDGEGRHLTKHYTFLRRLALPLVRRTLRTYLSGSDGQIHRGPLTWVLRPLKKLGEWLTQYWRGRYGTDGLDARLRPALWLAYRMLDELEKKLKHFAGATNARGKSKLKQKSELRDDYDPNQLLYLACLIAVAWSQSRYDEDGRSMGRAPLDDALEARRAPPHAGVRAATVTPQPHRRHFPAARKLVAIARWADGCDQPALPTELRTVIVGGVTHTVTNQAEVEALLGAGYTLEELIAGILAEDLALDSSASRGANRLLDPSNPRMAGQQWMIDFAQGSLAWRIDAR